MTAGFLQYVCLTVIWNNKALSEALRQDIKPEIDIAGISINSKAVKAGDLFVAIVGEKFDGNDFADEAIKNGAGAVLVNRMPDNLSDAQKDKYIVVKDTVEALDKLASYARNRVQGKVVGVTGSVGKTSTKEMLRASLQDQGEFFCTEGNLNNHYGLPLSVAQMPAETEYGVFEMGMSSAGEIAHLSSICKPDIAIVTSIAAVHLEFFSSVSAIAAAKSEIYDGMLPDSVAIVNADNIYSNILIEEAKKKRLGIIYFGESEEAHFQLQDYHLKDGHAYVTAKCYNEIFRYKIGAIGKHHAVNSLAVLAAVHAVGAELEFAAYQLNSFSAYEGRGLPYRANNVTVIDESYNASPCSVGAALQVLATYTGRRIAVLGNMAELGKDAKKYHEDLAEDVMKNKVDKVYTVGELMKHLHSKLPEELRAEHFDNSDDATHHIKDELREEDTVLIKGSNTMQMKKIVEHITS